jgi:hypothetical protein
MESADKGQETYVRRAVKSHVCFTSESGHVQRNS